MLPEPYTQAPASSEEDNWSWLVTFSDLVLQLFGFAVLAALAGAATHGVTASAPVANVSPVAMAAPPAARADVQDPQPDLARTEAESGQDLAGTGARSVVLDEDEDALPRVASVAADVPPAPAKTAPEPEPATPSVRTPRAARIAALGLYIEHLVGMQPELAAKVATGDDDVVVQIGDVAGFQPGSADPAPAMRPLLKELHALVAASNDLRVEVSGHTDDVPIRTAQFPSNLELSLARASKVAHELAESDVVLRSRISAAGYAEQRPVAPNGDAAGRARNRRVEIRIVRAG